MRSIRNCNVCVVGGAGFLGSHLVNHLIDDRGCKVLVIDNLVAGRREYVHKDAKFLHADITGSEDFLSHVFAKEEIRFVFNYAAHPYIPDSFARPLHVCNVNFFGAMKVINAAQIAGCEAVLQVSSAEIYGGNDTPSADPKLTQYRIDENFPVEPHSSYGASKAAVDSWVQVRWREAKTPCIALRQFNCVGPRETHPYIVPEIIGQLDKFRQLNVKDGKAWYEPRPNMPPVVKLGNNSFRDFMYAGDAVRIAVELLERGQFGEVYNLGSETGIKMYDLAKLIGKVMGFDDVTVEQDAARVRPWEIWLLLSANDKIKSVVGTKNLTTLEEAINKTVNWYNANGRKWSWE